jgi:DNA-directed RNA polymerase specialized sigma24 family protein
LSRADRTLDAALAKLAEKPSFERLVSQYTKRYRLPVAEVADAVQTSFYKTLKAYAGTTVEAPEALLHRVIRNELITVLRRSEVVKLIELDEDFLSIMEPKAHVVEDDDAGPERALVWQSDEKAKEETDKLADRRAARQASVQRTHEETAQHLENVLIETIDVRDLVRHILLQLDVKYRHVVILLLVEWTPDELREKFGRNGYRIRVWARVKVCRILGKLASAGHDLAQRMHGQGGCERILQSLQGGAVATPA